MGGREHGKKGAQAHARNGKREGVRERGHYANDGRAREWRE